MRNHLKATFDADRTLRPGKRHGFLVVKTNERPEMLTEDRSEDARTPCEVGNYLLVLMFPPDDSSIQEYGNRVPCGQMTCGAKVLGD